MNTFGPKFGHNFQESPPGHQQQCSRRGLRLARDSAFADGMELLILYYLPRFGFVQYERSMMRAQDFMWLSAVVRSCRGREAWQLMAYNIFLLIVRRE